MAAPLAWGDTLTVEEESGSFTIECDVGGIPTDDSNLIIKAAKAFAAETGWKGGARFVLAKRIPAGAGLGGASSNAVAALRALNELAGNPLEEAALARLASGIGSDCALFLPGRPVVMRGRGERVEPLPSRGPAAYGKADLGLQTRLCHLHTLGLRSAGRGSLELSGRGEGGRSDRRLGRAFGRRRRPASFQFHGDGGLCQVPGPSLLLGTVRERFGIAAAMSGSGSACFALPADGADPGPIAELVREAWVSSLFVDTRIA